MATAILDSPIEVVEGETKTLSTSAGFVAVKPTYHEIKLFCASPWRLALSPALQGVVYYTSSAGTYTHYETQTTDRLSTTHAPLDAMAATDYLYLGTTEPVTGFYFDVGTNVNATVTTLDMEYCSTAQVSEGSKIITAAAFTDVVGDSDGTAVAGAPLAQDGVYTWTLPAVERCSLVGVTGFHLYWMRFKPLLALSATVDINEIIPVYRNTSYAYMEGGVEYQFSLNTDKVGGLVVLATTGTPTLDISWI